MNATAHAAARTTIHTPDQTLASGPRPRTCHPADLGVRPCYFTARLADALIGAFAFAGYDEQIVHFLISGHSCKDIGRRLGIRETTVHRHMHRIFAKTGTGDRRELYDFARKLAANNAFGGSPRLRAAA